MLKSKGRSSPHPDGDKPTRKDSKKDKKEQLVYQQTPLHAIDDAPEPKKTGKSIVSHAVSAADLLNQSLNNLDSSSHHQRRGSSSNNNNAAHHRSASFVLQGSTTSLLTKGVGSGAVNVRRRSYSDTNLTIPTSAAGSGSGATSPKSDKDGRILKDKRNIYVPKDLEQGVNEAFRVNDSNGNDETGEGNANSDTSDSYDANVLGDGMDSDISETAEASDGRSNMMNRQVSNLSNGKGFGSVAELSMESDDYDDDDDFPGSVTSEDDDGPMSCCGIRACRVRRCIKGNRIASAFVRYAPCFWCFPIPVSATDRTILTRLNIISAFLAIGQVIATAWLVIIMLIPPKTDHEGDDQYSITHGMQPNLWSLTGSMYSIGFFGMIILVSNLVTLRVIQVVNLVGAIRYLWVLLYLVPFQIFFVLSLVDLYSVTHVWIKHWWLVPSMAWFRETYCAPGTAGTLCMVPIYADDAAYNGTDWCIDKYQATNCIAIRDAAQIEVEDLMVFFYNSNVVWGVVLIMTLLLIVNTLERIISRPLVQKSRESNVPAWLSLPFLGCTIVGVVFRYSPSSVLSARSESTYSWVGTAYMACGMLFFLTAILGWFISTFSILSGRDKRYKHMSVIFFILLMAITSFILTVIFVASISYSVALVDIPISPDQENTIACGVDTADSCSNCDGSNPDEPLCPEWSLEDVTSVLQTQTKGSATLAFIFFLYSFSALRFGFVLRKHVTMYQIDYV